MVRPKKRLGQHFLHDENIAEKISGLISPSLPLVLEVGPGTGILTRHLLRNPHLDLWVIEIDPESVAHLKKNIPQLVPHIIEDDFLKYDLTLFPPLPPPAPPRSGRESGIRQPFSIIGNFPYNISSQILFKALEHRDRVREVTGMFQKEVAERIASGPGTKQYGILSVLLQAFYDIEYLFTVNEHVFFPPPKVKSAVIRLRRNARVRLDCDEKIFTLVVKTAFNQRRKTLRNSLRQLLAEHGTASTGALFDERPERLSVEAFTGLTLQIQGSSHKIE
jgi:16S rRNA (adenine1518-N6/adenine1519-N6)-dimethyltransferase